MEPFIGLIVPWPLDWAPNGWLPCDGRSLPIRQYSALFALLGITYGGDGINTFNLPDLRGRFPVGFNNGSAPGNVIQAGLGARAGSTSQTVPLQQHAHGLSAVHANSVLKVGSSSTGTSVTPTTPTAYLVASPSVGTFAAQIYQASAPAATADVNAVTTTVSGTTDPAGASGGTLNVTNPYLALNFIIAVQGIFPSRP